MKVTKPQRELLNEACVFDGVTVSADYAPAKGLQDKGLAKLHELMFGGTMIRPTKAGREWIAEQSAQQNGERK